jgi:hypothetical protein
MSATAVKESQKPGESGAQGSAASTTAAASARVRTGAAMPPVQRAIATMVTM